MKAFLIPAAAVALLAGCSTWDQPYGSYYPGSYPAGGIHAPTAPYATMGDYRYGGNAAPYIYGGNVAPYYRQANPYGRTYRDTDGDGIRNSRDPDKDGDGVPNVYDARPNNPNRR